MTTRIIFNGREYKSPDEMPADVRRLYDQALQQLADADRDGIPDILEQGPEAGNVIGIQHSSFNVNGRNYASVDEMPWAVRRLFEKAMENVDANRDGIPDALQPDTTDSKSTSSDTIFEREFRWAGDPARRPRAVTGSGPRQGLLLLGGIMIALVALLFWWL